MRYTLTEIRSIPIFFIVGKGRSGTTLLSTVLDSHPNIASATESRFLLLIWQKYKHMKVWKPEMAEDFYNSVMADFRVEFHWEFDEDFIPALKQLPPETKVQDLIKMVYLYKKSFFPKERIRFIVDKNPRYTLFVNHLKRIFKDAKFIRIIRDPRDNVTSSIKYNKSACDAIADKWVRYNKIFDAFERKYPQISTTRKFEDLIDNQKKFYQDFEEYTGMDSLLEGENKRLNIKEEFEENLSDVFKEQHAATVKPIDKSKIGHYKKRLRPKQIEKIESVAFPYAERFGYRTDNTISKLPLKRRIRLLRKFLYFHLGNLVVYHLPYPLLLKARQFVLTKMMKNKLERYKNPKRDQ